MRSPARHSRRVVEQPFAHVLNSCRLHPVSKANTDAIKMITKTIISLLFVTTLSLTAAEPKKVLVVTVTTEFRHSSIGTAEKVLQKLADDSKAFTIVDFVRQPKVNAPQKP